MVLVDHGVFPLVRDEDLVGDHIRLREVPLFEYLDPERALL